MFSHRLPICLPAQLTMCETLLATTNSRSYTHTIMKRLESRFFCIRRRYFKSTLTCSNTYLRGKLIPDEQTVLYFDCSDHILRHHHRLLHLLHGLRMLVLLHLRLHLPLKRSLLCLVALRSPHKAHLLFSVLQQTSNSYFLPQNHF